MNDILELSNEMLENVMGGGFSGKNATEQLTLAQNCACGCSCTNGAGNGAGSGL